MHEVGLMQSALALAVEQTKSQGLSKIHSIDLNVGELSGVVPEALKFAFEVVSVGTLAEGAQLNLNVVHTLCYCRHCCREFYPMSWIYKCPRCQCLSSDIREGQNLELVSLEMS
ncbi:MAG: hydrogenase maturation nickel metallochaperone HypA [Phormidesmis sp. RL_2_1]|nr:hydrogenase maturation nickel metallochaperone HypA [Phormidesmis sp. RL_2_1]